MFSVTGSVQTCKTQREPRVSAGSCRGSPTPNVSNFKTPQDKKVETSTQDKRDKILPQKKTKTTSEEDDAPSLCFDANKSKDLVELLRRRAADSEWPMTATHTQHAKLRQRARKPDSGADITPAGAGAGGVVRDAHAGARRCSRSLTSGCGPLGCPPAFYCRASAALP